jgi:hypothetical protein
MPDQVKTPLLAAGNDLIVAAFKAIRAGWCRLARHG